MATFRLQSFSHAEVLRMADRSRLLQLLDPFRSFFDKRNCPLPPIDGNTPINYEKLIGVFMNPDDSTERTPQTLIDTLYVIDEMATTEGMDALLNAVRDADIRLDGNRADTPIDVAIQVWLADQELVQNKHAEQYLLTPRSFEYFPRSVEEVPDFKLPASKVLRAMEPDLDKWFEEHRRGRGARVFMFPREGAVWFMVRHGQPLRREGSIEAGKSTSVLYRPECFDIVIYDHSLGELRIHAGSKGEKSLYREVFGKHLFGSAGFFGVGGKFTLDPLRVSGEACLECADIEGIERIDLCEVQFHWGGAQTEVEVRKASNVFAAYASRERSFPVSPKITKAVFNVKFADSTKTRKVTVSVPNRTSCRRNEDSTLVERWLLARGFTVNSEAATSSRAARTGEVLVES